MKDIPENVKLVAKSIAPFLIVLILSIMVGNFGFSKIGSIRSEIDQARVTQNSLKVKVDAIQALQGNISNFSSAAAVALPDSNTALAVIGHLKNLAVANSLLLTEIKTGGAGKDTSGLSKVDIGFNVEGPRPQISIFLKAISGIAPITVVERIKITESGGASKAGVSVTSFWAPLPTTLPATDQPLVGLTPDEEATLKRVSSLTQPTFTQISPSAGGKTNPFTQ